MECRALECSKEGEMECRVLGCLKREMRGKMEYQVFGRLGCKERRKLGAWEQTCIKSGLKASARAAANEHQIEIQDHRQVGGEGAPYRDPKPLSDQAEVTRTTQVSNPAPHLLIQAVWTHTAMVHELLRIVCNDGL
eukprot:1148257-Pelagomonas_calceolata.AAC.3